MAERRLAAIMFTDIVGYTAVMAESEQRGRRVRERHRRVLGLLAEQYGGQIVDENGDELVLSFPSAVDAVNCGLAVQSELRDDAELRLRVGIHQGDVVFEDGRIYGDGVNVASRIRPLAEPGGVCVSDEVQHAVQNQENVETRSLGSHELKNVLRRVEVFAVSGTAEPRRPVSKPAPLSNARAFPLAGWAAALLVSVAIGVGWWLYRPTTDLRAIRSIAVLPLENLSGDPEQEYFVDGMTEVLIADLARVRGLRVISRTSSMAYRNSSKTLPVIARELDVDAVVEGSVLRAGDRVRITAQLIRASSDEHLWSDSYERDLQDVLALQGEVAQAIAGEIELQLSGSEKTGSASRPVDPGSLEAYLKGRHHWNRRGEGIRKSIEYFETAIALDPNWALAHSGLAEAYVLLATFDPSVQPHDSMPRARAAAERALELDDELAPAHNALAGVRQYYDWDWEGAEAEFQRALELDPSYATAHYWFAMHRILMKKPDALEHGQRARELDPLSMQIGTGLGMVLFYTREYDRSIDTLRETLELDPRFATAQDFLARAYSAKGMHEQAVEVAEQFARSQQGSYSMVSLAGAYAAAGRREDALQILEEVRGSPIQPVNMAYVYAALGVAEVAFEWLEKAYERRSLQLTGLQGEPIFDPLRSDPRFQDLVRRIGFPES